MESIPRVNSNFLNSLKVKYVWIDYTFIYIVLYTTIKIWKKGESPPTGVVMYWKRYQLNLFVDLKWFESMNQNPFYYCSSLYYFFTNLSMLKALHTYITNTFMLLFADSAT